MKSRRWENIDMKYTRDRNTRIYKANPGGVFLGDPDFMHDPWCWNPSKRKKLYVCFFVFIKTIKDVSFIDLFPFFILRFLIFFDLLYIFQHYKKKKKENVKKYACVLCWSTERTRRVWVFLVLLYYEYIYIYSCRYIYIYIYIYLYI